MGHVGGLSAFASDVERIVVNQTNPDPALGDDRSEYLGGANPHPFLTFTPIPQAMSIDRARIAEQLYGFAEGPHAILSWPREVFFLGRSSQVAWGDPAVMGVFHPPVVAGGRL